MILEYDSTMPAPQQTAELAATTGNTQHRQTGRIDSNSADSKT
jgi:hypothetical protein